MAATNFGIVFKIGPTSTPATTLAEVFEISSPKQSRDAIDVTTHASAGGVMEYIADPLYEPGDLTVSMNYMATSATDTAILAALAASANYYFQWTAKTAAGATKTFTTQGIVVEYGQDPQPLKGKQTATMKVKLSGAVTVA